LRRIQYEIIKEVVKNNNTHSGIEPLWVLFALFYSVSGVRNCRNSAIAASAAVFMVPPHSLHIRP